MNQLIENLIRRARRRFVLNEALSQLTFAAAIALAGLAVLLILGTRYLEWWELAVFAAAGIAFGAVRVYRSVPGDYGMAVRVDRNARLGDALSTAIHFSREGSEFQQAQRRQAEDAAREVNLEAAVPFTSPRALYAMAGLAVLASGLVTLRYRSARGLDLAAPLTQVLFEDEAAKQADRKRPAADAAERKRLETAESLLAKLGIPLNPDDRKQTDALDQAIERALEAPGDPAAKGQSAGKQDGGKEGNGAGKEPTGDPLDGKESDKGDQSDKGQNAKDGAAGDKGNTKKGPGDGGSLLSKLKDAVSDMFSKAAPGDPAKKGQAQQQGQASKSDKGGGEKSSAGKGQDQAQSQAEAQNSEPEGDAQDGQQAQAKAGSKSAQQSSQAGSGVGSQDGAKDLRAAEQLKAMGKISEIIGKRAATVTGETTIEVQSGNQQLRTAYTNKAATHGEADSDVNRDEIPSGLQSYVQQYFEQVRKAAKGKAEKTATP